MSTPTTKRLMALCSSMRWWGSNHLWTSTTHKTSRPPYGSWFEIWKKEVGSPYIPPLPFHRIFVSLMFLVSIRIPRIGTPQLPLSTLTSSLLIFAISFLVCLLTFPSELRSNELSKTKPKVPILGIPWNGTFGTAERSEHIWGETSCDFLIVIMYLCWSKWAIFKNRKGS